MRVDFRPATLSDVREFSDIGFRSADAREAWRLGQSPDRLLLRSVRDSQIAVAGLADGVVQAIFGVRSAGLLGNVGHVWMVAHDFVGSVPRSFLRHCRLVLRAMLEEYHRLENIVDVDNVVTIRWLEHMGFVVEKDAPVHSPLGYPFWRFWMEG